MNEQAIQSIVETCWRIASDANMPGVQPMVMANVIDQHGLPCFCAHRVQLFNTLVANLLPKGEQGVRHHHERARESWEGNTETDE
jgi:hypothetical protein